MISRTSGNYFPELTQSWISNLGITSITARWIQTYNFKSLVSKILTFAIDSSRICTRCPNSCF
ncbi:hypothetical protein ERS043873_02030, partial [Streptococcus pneumoniae]